MIEDVKYANKQFLTGELEHPFGRGINIQIQVKAVMPIIKKIKKHKYRVWHGININWYRKDNRLLGNKEFLVKDPDGYLLRIFENIGTKPIK